MDKSVSFSSNQRACQVNIIWYCIYFARIFIENYYSWSISYLFLIILPTITWMSWILCIQPQNQHYRRLSISVWRIMMLLLQLQDLLNHSGLFELKIGWICIQHLELQCDYMVEYLWRARVECVILDQPWFANIECYVLYSQKFRFIIDYK